MTDDSSSQQEGSWPADLLDSSGMPRLWARWRQLWEPYTDLLDPSLYDFLPVQEWAPPPEYHPILSSLSRKFRPLALGRVEEEERERNLGLRFGAVMDEVRAKAPEGRDFLSRWRVLEVLDAGNRLGRWNIPVEKIPAPLPAPPRQVFSTEQFERFVEQERLFDSFIESVTNTTVLAEEGQPQAFSWGRLLLSLVCYSGVLDSKALLAVPEAIFRSPAHGYWLDISIGHSDRQQATLRRYFLDPISRHLVLRLRRQLHGEQAVESPFGRRDTRSLYRVIRAYGVAQSFESLLPSNWADLKKLATTRLALYLPPHLLGFARGYYTSASLPSQSMARLFDPPTEVVEWAEREEAEIPIPLAPDFETSEGQAEDDGLPNIQHHALVSLVRAAQGSRKDALESIKLWRRQARQHEGDDPRAVPPSILRLADWALEVLSSQSSKDTRTLRSMLTAVAPSLVGQMGWSDFTDLQVEDDFIAIYTNVLDEADSGAERKRVAKGLQSLHGFLVETQEAPSLHDSGLFGTAFRQPHAVDANLVDPETFHWVCHYLRHTHVDDPELGTTRILMAVLGFFGGLRRSEVVGLCLGDFDGPPEYDLVVSPNLLRTLKTDNANRVIPIEVLIPEEYRALLTERVAYQKERAIEAGMDPRDTLLFSSELQSTRARTVRQFDGDLDAVTQALARMSRDPTLRFHHFRHSFAQRMLMALWYYENKGTECGRPCWFQHLLGFDSVSSMRERLLGQAPVQRRSLRLISMLLGHSTTEITMNHYIHCADLLLGRAVRRAIPELRVEQIAALADVQPTRVYDVAREIESASVCDQLDQLADTSLPKAHRLYWPEPINQKVLLTPPDPYQELLMRTDALNHLALHSTLEGRFVYPYDRAKLEAACVWLESLPEHFRMSSRGLGAALIEPPRTQQDRRLARRIVHLLKGDQRLLRPEQFGKLAESYLAGKQPDHPMQLLCDRVPLLNWWSRLLNAAGLGHELELTHWSSSTLAEVEQLAYWRERMPDGWVVQAGGKPSLDRAPRLPKRGAILLSLRIRSATRWRYGFVWAMTCLALDRLHWAPHRRQSPV